MYLNGFNDPAHHGVQCAEHGVPQSRGGLLLLAVPVRNVKFFLYKLLILRRAYTGCYSVEKVVEEGR